MTLGENDKMVKQNEGMEGRDLILWGFSAA